jgi:hypothetical protein
MEDLHRQRFLSEQAGRSGAVGAQASFVTRSVHGGLGSHAQEMGIEPIGAVNVDLSEVVAYREIAERN